MSIFDENGAVFVIKRQFLKIIGAFNVEMWILLQFSALGYCLHVTPKPSPHTFRNSGWVTTVKQHGG